MRQRPVAVLALALLLPLWPVAVAQEATEEEQLDQEEGDAAETEGAEVADPPAPGPGARGRDTAPGEVHTVVRGDTMWDLSQRYLGNPWYWPKVWSYNPEIANPHWIYPGNQVRFFPTGEDTPARVVTGVGPGEDPIAAGTQMEGTPEGPDGVTPGEALGLETEEFEGVQVVGKIGYTQPKATRVTTESFVTARELEEAGVIHSSFSESVMLSYPNTVYVKFKNPGNAKVGDPYVIFKTVREIKHPITGDRLGFQTQFIGAMVVTKLHDGLVTAQITNSWDEVNRGHFVGPFGERLSDNVTVKPNSRELTGVLVGTQVPFLTMAGEHHNVFVDKGSADGVEVGNTFTVVRQNDGVGNFFKPFRDQRGDLPVEDIATCMAVDVKENLTTCLMIRSIREVVPGDRVEMRVTRTTAAMR